MGIFCSKDAASLEGDEAPREWQAAPQVDEPPAAAVPHEGGLAHHAEGAKEGAEEAGEAEEVQHTEQVAEVQQAEQAAEIQHTEQAGGVHQAEKSRKCRRACCNWEEQGGGCDSAEIEGDTPTSSSRSR